MCPICRMAAWMELDQGPPNRQPSHCMTRMPTANGQECGCDRRGVGESGARHGWQEIFRGQRIDSSRLWSSVDGQETHDPSIGQFLAGTSLQRA